MSNNKSIGDRFKEYEDASRYYLPRRLPIIIRLDGKAFHTLTRKLDRPYDKHFTDLMVETAREVCERMQTCQIAYAQSDEISFLLINYQKLNTEPWFGNAKSKMESISASMAAAHFNYALAELFPVLKQKVARLGYFDARAFVIPPSEVCNYFIWRQQDATRNAIQMAAQAHFSHKSLQNQDCNRLQERLFSEAGINFNDYPTFFRRGTAIHKVKYEAEILNTHDSSVKNTVERTRWDPDWEIPLFTADRFYIEQHIPEYGDENDE